MKIEKSKFDSVLVKMLKSEPQKRSETKSNPKPKKAQKSSAQAGRMA